MAAYFAGITALLDKIYNTSSACAVLQTYRRIVRVDLKFPERPSVSSGAKEFIRQVRHHRLLFTASHLHIHLQG